MTRQPHVYPASIGVAALVLALAAGLGLGGCAGARAGDAAQAAPARLIGGADAVRSLSFPPLRFQPPEPELFQLSNGVTVVFLSDWSLPVVDVFVDFSGGYMYHGREDFGVASSLLSLMRHGGTTSLEPDSLDAVLEYHAIGVSTYGNGSRMLMGVRGLRRHLDLAIQLWADMLLRPRFDPAAMERWRVRELDAVRNLSDFPGSLAVAKFNQILYDEHPTGWILEEADLARERLGRERLVAMHRQTVCPETAVVGAAGALTRQEARSVLEQALADWRPCGRLLELPPPPEVRARPAVYVIPKTLAQSTIVVGQPGGVLLEDSPAYYASRIANWVIGGSGVTSRLASRLRTEQGLAYTASSVWGVARDHERIFGAITHTRADATIDAARLILSTLSESVAEPPTSDEVELARESISNGFIFGVGSPAQIVARQVSYMADDLPSDWMVRYLTGIGRVNQRQVARVLRDKVRPDAFTVLIVGDTTAFDPRRLGPVTILPDR